MGAIDPVEERLEKFYPLDPMPDRKFGMAAVGIVADRLGEAIQAWLPIFRLHGAGPVESASEVGLWGNISLANTLGLLSSEMESDLRILAEIYAACSAREAVRLSRPVFAEKIERLLILNILDQLADRDPGDIETQVLRLNLNTPRNRLRMAARQLDAHLQTLVLDSEKHPFRRFNSGAVPPKYGTETLSDRDAAYKEALGKFDGALKLSIATSRRLSNIPSSTGRIYWASVLFSRMCNFGVSISKLLPGSPFSNVNSDTKWDNSSISALVRSLYECFLVFHYIGVEDVQEDEANARQQLMYLHDCTMRLRVFHEDEGPDSENFKFYSGERTRLIADLSSNTYFLQISEKRQKHLLKGRDLLFLTQDEIIEKAAGAPAQPLRRLFELLSAHVHSLPMAYYRTLEDDRGRGVENDPEKAYIAQSVSFGADLFALAESHYESLFPDAESEGRMSPSALERN